MSIDLACRVCGDEGPHPAYCAREMMFGIRDTFDYFECTSCGTLQIGSIPSDLSEYYPDNYYSFGISRQNMVAEFVILQRSRHAFGMPNLFGGLVGHFKRDDPIAGLGVAKPRLTDRILDVGSGSGKILDRLAAVGFKKLQGVDPFVDHDFKTTRGVPIRKQDLSEVKEQFEIIMFHHSIEHVGDPAKALRDAEARLVPGGICVVRIPTPSSEAWETYRTDWVQLDAPRHLVLPSRKGMQILAEKASLKVELTVDDSTYNTFVLSERYRRDIPMHGPSKSFAFSRRQISAFRRQARNLNKQGRGDQAIFVLRKPA